MIHASDILNLNRCAKLGRRIHDHQLATEGYAHAIAPYRTFYVPFLHAQNYAQGHVGDSTQDSLQLLEHAAGGLDIRIEAEGIRTRFPVLERIEGGWKAIYPLRSHLPSEHELALLSLNQYLAQKAGLPIISHELVYIDKDYVRKEQIDPFEMLKRTDRFFRRKGNPCFQTIDQMLEKADFDWPAAIEQARTQLEQTDEPQPERCKSCLAPRRCVLYEECFQESRLPDDSMAFLASQADRIARMEQGYASLADAAACGFEGQVMQYAQVAAAKQGGRFVDERGLKAWLSDLQWPLIYLDFEWDTFLFPPYEGMQPYDVLCFQYSMHVEHKDGTLEHYSFFGSGDCRQAFIDSLCRQIPEEGTVLVYNMEGAEKLRLMQLARQFPQAKRRLEPIWNRMKDLAVPFASGIFYDVQQRGHFSLKSLLPILTGTDGYAGLEVQDGLQAIHAYRRHETSRDLQQRDEIARSISTYCAMDTLAEVYLFHALQAISRHEPDLYDPLAHLQEKEAIFYGEESCPIS